MRAIVLATASLILVSAFPSLAVEHRRELGIAELLRLAETTSPDLAGSRELENADEKAVTSARSGYLPYLHLDAIESTGFPGSTSQLGISGVAGSPYRSGWATDLVLNQTLWDFGRTGWSVEAAKHFSDARKWDSDSRRIDIDRAAAQEYFSCVRYRDQIEAWQFMLDEAKVVANEVKKFVQTGQRSIVERYLVDAQVDEATTVIADYRARIDLALRRIGTFTRLDWKEIDCPSASVLTSPSHVGGESVNPRILSAIERTEALRAKAEAASAERYPKLVGLASVGMLQNSRLVEKKNYALGIGLTMPLYTGGKTSAEIDRAQYLAMAKDDDSEGERDRVDLTNAKYDEAIEGTKTRLQYLAHELELGEKAFTLAKRRYFALQGSLVDVREALRNLIRSKTGISEARSTLLEATYAKAIFNGWRPSRHG